MHEAVPIFKEEESQLSYSILTSRGCDAARFLPTSTGLAHVVPHFHVHNLQP